MSKPNSLPILRSTGLLAAFQGDQSTKLAAAVQRDAFIERTARAAERDLGLLEISDIEVMTARSIIAAGAAARQAVIEVEANPYSARAVERLERTGAHGLNQVLRRYIDRS